MHDAWPWVIITTVCLNNSTVFGTVYTPIYAVQYGDNEGHPVYRVSMDVTWMTMHTPACQ